MPDQVKPRLKIITAILLFAFASIALTVINVSLVAYSIQKDVLINRVVSSNDAYAERIAASIDTFTTANLSRLSFAAAEISKKKSGEFKQETAARLEAQDENFNSAIVTNEAGVIVAASPESMSIKGKKLNNMEPVAAKKTMVSNAFISVAGNLVVFLSTPIFNDKKEYLGLLGGTIRIDEKNSLHSLINTDVKPDGSYTFVVDSTGRILYHHDKEKIGRLYHDDKSIMAAINDDASFFKKVTGDYIYRYGASKKTGWRIIVKTPFKKISSELNLLILEIGAGVIPLAIIGILLICAIRLYISGPLSRLAQYSRSLDSFESYNAIRNVPARFVEIWLIRSALLFSSSRLNEVIHDLNSQAKRDALTGLANRRLMRKTIDSWCDENKGFAILSIDIDHFKKVNDTYGHTAGDDALKSLATVLESNCRSEGIAVRAGGEEFFILIPDISIERARSIAEKVRTEVQNTQIEIVGFITVSIGVTTWKPNTSSISEAFEQADKLLYAAKQNGRNRVESQSLDIGICAQVMIPTY
ncbi:TPA: sensor domain-containing diguanylate cyclase [Citrobacter freundii]